MSDEPGAALPRTMGAAAPVEVAACFPLAMRYARNYEDDYFEPRDGGRNIHGGTDILCPEGAKVHAMAAKKVIYNGPATGLDFDQGGGNCVVFEVQRTVGPLSRYWYVLYAHLRVPSPLRVGALVGPGFVVGEAGSTGNSTESHLHVTVISHYRSGADMVRENPFHILNWLRGETPPEPERRRRHWRRRKRRQ